MSTDELIASIERIGGRIYPNGDRIHYRLPGTTEGERLLAEIKARRDELLAVLRERSKPCGAPDCAGCYDVGEGRRIHPPKASAEYLEWLTRWEAKGRVQ